MADERKSKLIKIERCVYCEGFIENENVLNCQKCKKNVHIKCLPNASTPGDLIGDIFFDLTCIECVRRGIVEGPTTSKASVVKEILVRQRLPWLIVIVLVFYNLGIKAKGLSHNGFFHWQNHIANFIEKNWRYLFHTQPRRRNRWSGTLASVLSQYSPEFFISGTETCQQHGWWKLTHSNRTPKYIYMLYEQHCQKRQQQRQEKRTATEDTIKFPIVEAKKLKERHSADSEEDAILMGSCSRALPYMGRKPKVEKQLKIDEEDNRTAVQSNLMDFLAETFSSDDLTMFNINSLPVETGLKNEFIPFLESHEDNGHFFDMPEMKIEKNDIENFSGTTELISSKNNDTTIDHDLKAIINDNVSSNIQMENVTSDNEDDDDNNDDDDDDEYRPRIVQVTNYQHPATTEDQQKLRTTLSSKVEQVEAVVENITETVDEADSNVMVKSEYTEETTESLPSCKPSLFTKHERRLWPWLIQKDDVESGRAVDDLSENDKQKSLIHMSLYEEMEMLDKLRKIFALEEKCKLEIPTHIRRFFRKLCIREWKRSRGKPLFDLDNYGNNYLRDANQNEDESTILDRYQLISVSSEDSKKTFYARIAGSQDHEFFQSPYTNRILHPFIYRHRLCFPPWLKLMCEIQYATTGEPPIRAPIDYCYVRPNHIAAVNALLEMLFWPGIDMSDCLSYPDYSIVALYKQLVIGCGFLVPDTGYNEAYISFMGVRPGWRRSGIASFMLYHLIQTCMTKDITLHVSASNPAAMLYQKFGFKIEEIVYNFYDKYLPIDSKYSRHALYLRLPKEF